MKMKAKRARGRPSIEITPSLLEEILRAIREGVPASAAAVAAGVSKATFQRWLARGRKEISEGSPRSEFQDFCDAIEKGRAEFIRRTVKIVYDAGPSSWQAAMCLLERRDPENFARKSVIAGDNEKPLGITVTYSRKWRELSPQGEGDPSSTVDET